MKQELMRPELNSTQFIQFNYWDAGHQGLLSGEALHLDVKRLEMAYLDNNTRELELTRHVSLRQLDPMALLALKITGSCTVSDPRMALRPRLPRSLHAPDQEPQRDDPSASSGPIRASTAPSPAREARCARSPLLANGAYARSGQNDDRFVDYFGSTDVIVTSHATNDSGMFETNLRDERFLPFEGAGAISTWNLRTSRRTRGVRLLDDHRPDPPHPLHGP